VIGRETPTRPALGGVKYKPITEDAVG